MVIETPDPLEGLDPFERQVVQYFKEISLGFEFGGASEITRKWASDVFITVEGEMPDYLLSELSLIIEEINELATDGFSVSLADKTTSSNFRIFFGSGAAYGELNPNASSAVSSNRGLFYVSWNANQNLVQGDMYVDVFAVAEVFQRHLLREELTQALGLAMDSSRYPNSIFQQSWTDVTEYAPIDRELIRLLYHPKMVSGLDEDSVTDVLVEILNE